MAGLLGLDARQLVGLFLFRRGQFVEMLEVAAQVADQFGARPGNVGVIAHMARQLVGVLAAQENFQVVVLAMQVQLGEQLAELRLLLGNAGLGLAAVLLQARDLAVGFPLLLSQFVDHAVGGADGLFRMLQGIAGVGLGAFGAFHFFLQRLDAVAQLTQFALGRRSRRSQGRQCAKHGQPSAPSQHLFQSNSISELPVISGGCGRPIIFSRLGATSLSAPPSASFAGRPT